MRNAPAARLNGDRLYRKSAVAPALLTGRHV
jgi:hypothetical protein